MTIDERTAKYMDTIIDAARKGTVSLMGLEVCSLILRGYTLDAAKQQHFENERRAIKQTGRLAH